MARAMTPTEDQKVQLFRDSMYYEIVHTFGVPAEVTDGQLDNHAIGETINFSRHVHARLLSHFLLRRPCDKKANKDDVFAEDFGFNPATELVLSEVEREEKVEHKDLNKGLIHLTYGRVTGATNKPWINPVIKELLPVTIRFMRHILDNEGAILSGGRELFADQQKRKGWATLLACLEMCQKGERLRFKSGFSGQKTWYEPTTEKGAVATLYGTKEEATPRDAVVLSTLTNTTVTSIEVDLRPENQR